MDTRAVRLYMPFEINVRNIWQHNTYALPDSATTVWVGKAVHGTLYTILKRTALEVRLPEVKGNRTSPSIGGRERYAASLP